MVCRVVVLIFPSRLLGLTTDGIAPVQRRINQTVTSGYERALQYLDGVIELHLVLSPSLPSHRQRWNKIADPVEVAGVTMGGTESSTANSRPELEKSYCISEGNHDLEIPLHGK